MVCSAFAYDHMLQFEVVNVILNSQNYRDEILEPDVRSSLNTLKCQNMVLEDNNARPQRARIIEEYKNLRNITSLRLPSLSPDLNISNTCGTSSADVFETANQPYRPFVNFAKLFWRSLRLPRLKRMKQVTSIIERCQVVSRQKGCCTQFKRK